MRKRTFICITVDGKVSFREKMSLNQMQKFVGGHIEYCGQVICNEDGRSKKLPTNKVIPFICGNLILDVGLVKR